MFNTVAAQFGAEASSGDILSTLGVDVKLLAFQIVAFLLLVFILGKWIFPIFFKIVDKRQALIDESNRAAVEASKHAENAQAETEKLLKKAREEAKDIVTTAREEAVAVIGDAEVKSKQQAAHLVADAKDQIAKEVVAAKRALHNETVDLVMVATGRVLEDSIDAHVDKAVVEHAIKEAQ